MATAKPAPKYLTVLHEAEGVKDRGESLVFRQGDRGVLSSQLSLLRKKRNPSPYDQLLLERIEAVLGYSSRPVSKTRPTPIYMGILNKEDHTLTRPERKILWGALGFLQHEPEKNQDLIARIRRRLKGAEEVERCNIVLDDRDEPVALPPPGELEDSSWTSYYESGGGPGKEDLTGACLLADMLSALHGRVLTLESRFRGLTSESKFLPK